MGFTKRGVTGKTITAGSDISKLGSRMWCERCGEEYTVTADTVGGRLCSICLKDAGGADGEQTDRGGEAV